MDTTRPKLLLVGASGAIGRPVHQALLEYYDVITASRHNADVRLDLTDPASVTAVLASVGPLDAIVSVAGRANFVALKDVEPVAGDESKYALGLQDKLMGQVNLALASRGVIRPGGAIVLTSGTTAVDPILGGSSLSMVNGALEAWVRAAATEWPDAVRINLVSPSLVEGTPAEAIKAFPGWPIITGEQLGLAYIRCLRSGITGQTVTI
ncbi:MAG: short chain dehydrogenase [Propionibacteriaceae bacterium]|nr:short chain dehydrogenase [Propionibacteriaceae bacterium]